jgi:hypothetical protein
MRTPALNLKDMLDCNVFVASVSWKAVLYAQHRAHDEWCQQNSLRPDLLMSKYPYVSKRCHGVAAGRMDERPELDLQFHPAICKAAASQVLTDVLLNLTDKVRWIGRARAGYPSRIREALYEMPCSTRSKRANIGGRLSAISAWEATKFGSGDRSLNRKSP